MRTSIEVRVVLSVKWSVEVGVGVELEGLEDVVVVEEDKSSSDVVICESPALDVILPALKSSMI